VSDALYQTFLGFMDELDAFRDRYAMANPGVPLDREDPDTNRLVEALAFFSARSHLAAQDRVSALHRRLFEQHFPYVLDPLPAMAVVEIRPRDGLVEATTVPTGTEMVFSTEDEVQAQFRTTRPVELLPLRYLDMMSGERPGGRRRFMLRLDGTQLPVGASLATLSIHIRHLGDYGASLFLLDSLRTHIERVSLLSGPRLTLGDVLDDDQGMTCKVSYGLLDRPGDREPTTVHPIARSRNRLHFPEQDLFINVHTPDTPPWRSEPYASDQRQVCICLDVGPGWPTDLRPTTRSFVFFATPVINLIHEPAEPIRNDGTKVRFRIRPTANPSPRMLHSVRGIYRRTPAGMEPLKSGLVSAGEDAYELERTTHGAAIRCDLIRRAPGAFAEPELLSVDADWFQPHFADHLSSDVAISPYRRHSRDFTLHLVGRGKRHRTPTSGREVDLFARALGVRMRPAMDLDDVRSLLGLVDAVTESHFRDIPNKIQGLQVTEEMPQGRWNSQGTFTYRFYVTESLSGPGGSVLGYFLATVNTLIDAWVVNASVQVEAVSTDQADALTLARRQP